MRTRWRLGPRGRALGGHLRSAFTAAGFRRPLLSVVVPVYNVEDYLDECLRSIGAQSFRDLEVVLVDDGSTDSSGRIARRYARRSPRVRLIRQDNAGLGAARNVGARAARGRFLAFADSDDTLPPNAYSTMVGTLQRTGSDLVVGMLMRQREGRTWTMPLMRRNHARERLGITVDEMPEILADVFAFNKVYRRSFWDEAGLSFPERVLYEDQVALTRAFLTASHIDVITETVYFWRVRGDSSSITQRRHEIADLKDRLLTKRLSTRTVDELGSPEVKRVWWGVVLPVDMFLYFRSVPGCTDEYWTMLRDGFRELWGEAVVPFSQARLPVQRRLMGWLVENDRREQLVELVRFLDESSGEWPLEVRGDRVVAGLPGLDDPESAIPPEAFELAGHELEWEARLLGAEWTPGRLRLEGFAVIRNAPTGRASTTLWAEVAAGSALSTPVEVTPRTEPRATAWVGNGAQDHDAAGFTLDVDLVRLASASPDGPVGPVGPDGPDGPAASWWRFALRRRVEKLERGGSFTSWVAGVVGEHWHATGAGSEARLVEADGDIVLELRGSVSRAGPRSTR